MHARISPVVGGIMQCATHFVPVKCAGPGFQAVRAPRPVKLPAALACLLHRPAKVAGHSVATERSQAMLYFHMAAF